MGRIISIKLLKTLEPFFEPSPPSIESGLSPTAIDNNLPLSHFKVNRSLKQKRERKSTIDLRDLHPKVALRGKSKTQQREGSFSHCSVTNSGIRRRNQILSKQLSDQLEIRHSSPPFSPTK